MLPKVIDIINMIEDFAPSALAEKWDNIGLLIGDYNFSVQRIMLCIDVTRELVNEAILKKVNLIITHHPFIYEPLKNIRQNDNQGTLIHLLIKNNISVFCAHTNLDKAEYGTDYALASRLGLRDICTLLTEKFDQKLYKIAAFVPEKFEKTVFEAMAAAGAGHIGNYSHCSFQTYGTGTFLPLESADPYIGKKGFVESVREVRIEMVASDKILGNVLTAMIKVHPYDEVAYDVFNLANLTNRHGLGRIGTLANRIRCGDYLKQLSTLLNTDRVNVFGDLDKDIVKVAVCAGSGADLALSAKDLGAELFVTGEVKYHKALEIRNMNMSFVAAGHYATEFPVLLLLIEHLQKIASALQYEVELFLPDTVTDPFHVLK